MPLTNPPLAARALSGCAAEPLAGRAINRLWRHRGADGERRPTPWWFASTPPDDPTTGGRYDLPAPLGTCYTATSPIGAVLEALQAFLLALPVAELRARRMAHIVAPGETPSAADLTSPELAGVGVTAALWAGTDRPLTQRWAAAFRRDGWWRSTGAFNTTRPDSFVVSSCSTTTALTRPPTPANGLTPSLSRAVARPSSRAWLGSGSWPASRVSSQWSHPRHPPE
jgi:RES domain